MKTISNGDNLITVPNTFFCTKGRYAYVKCALESAVRNQDVTLEVYNVNNIVNGSHADWVAAVVEAQNTQPGDSALYLDHTLIRGELITYRVELKGESAQATSLGFEIKVHFTDNTDQWLARYTTPDIPDRGTFEKTYIFSSQVQDKEIE